MVSVNLAHRTDDAIILFEVHDTGIGLSVETQAHLFQLFSRADSSTTKNMAGRGWGWPSANKSRRSWGARSRWKVNLEQAVRSGSRLPSAHSLEIVRVASVHRGRPSHQPPYTGILCCEMGNQVPDGEEWGPGAGPAAIDEEQLSGRTSTSKLVTRHSLTEAKAHSTARILVAADHIVNQKIAVQMLGKLGYRVDLVANGLEALLAVANIPYDAVLMGCMMPVMDGFDATRSIREREAGLVKHQTSESGEQDTYRIPIIAMTANAGWKIASNVWLPAWMTISVRLCSPRS